MTVPMCTKIPVLVVIKQALAKMYWFFIQNKRVVKWHTLVIEILVSEILWLISTNEQLFSNDELNAITWN